MAGHSLAWQCAWIQDPQRTQWHVPNKDRKITAMDSKLGSALCSLRYDLVEPIPCLPGILPPPYKFPTPLYQFLGSSSCRTRETAESGTLGCLYGQLLIAFYRQRLNRPDGSGEYHPKVLCPMRVVAANERNGNSICCKDYSKFAFTRLMTDVLHVKFSLSVHCPLGQTFHMIPDIYHTNACFAPVIIAFRRSLYDSQRTRKHRKMYLTFRFFVQGIG